MDRISLKNMVFYGSHGTLKEERALGQLFEIDVDLWADLETPCREDKIALSLDYRIAYRVVERIVTGPSYSLLEALAGAIARTLLVELPAEQVNVRVRKPRVPIRGSIDCVEVELERRREADDR
jgi:dihydroneopterin aldolase